MTNDDRRSELRSILHSKGLRATPARVALLAALSDATGPVSHQELTEKLDDLGLDKSTVFRGLQDLTEVGLLHRLDLGDHVWRYEPVKEILGDQRDARSAEEHLHPHLLCVECGEIRCLSQEDVTIELSPKLGKVVDVLVKGHCQKCDTEADQA
jgi:Fur family ferric uptake transcriptional regulator